VGYQAGKRKGESPTENLWTKVSRVLIPPRHYEEGKKRRRKSINIAVIIINVDHAPSSHARRSLEC
jgi:hypothetical protein